MGRSEPNHLEMRRIRRLLRETVKLAEHASLTGSLDRGSRIAIRQYNRIREHLEEIEAIPEDLFQELDEEETTFDELGVACGMLDGYLEDDVEAIDADLKGGKKVQVGMVGLKELDDLKEIGKIIRESLPEFLRAQGGLHRHVQIELDREMEQVNRARPAAPPQPPQPPHPPHAPHTPHTPFAHDPRAQQMEQLTHQIRAVGEQMRNPDLAPGQREELLQRLDQLMNALQNVGAAPPEAS